MIPGIRSLSFAANREKWAGGGLCGPICKRRICSKRGSLGVQETTKRQHGAVGAVGIRPDLGNCAGRRSTVPVTTQILRFGAEILTHLVASEASNDDIFAKFSNFGADQVFNA